MLISPMYGAFWDTLYINTHTQTQIVESGVDLKCKNFTVVVEIKVILCCLVAR